MRFLPPSAHRVERQPRREPVPVAPHARASCAGRLGRTRSGRDQSITWKVARIDPPLINPHEIIHFVRSLEGCCSIQLSYGRSMISVSYRRSGTALVLCSPARVRLFPRCLLARLGGRRAKG